MLRLRTEAWFQRQERVGYHETSAALTALSQSDALTGEVPDGEYDWFGLFPQQTPFHSDGNTLVSVQIRFQQT
jgi:hypothetical protein